MKKEENLALYNEVRSVPDAAKTPISGGRMNGKTSIEPMWRIKVLTEQFGPCGQGWYYVPVKKWVETAGEELVVFVDIELYVKFGDEWSKPIHGTGGGKLISKEARGLNVSDECYKMATTDALSVACKQLGIGADVYWDKDLNGGNYASAPASCAQQHPPKQRTARVSPPALEKRYVNSLWNELKRTGIGVNSLLRNYRKRSIQELNFEEYKDAMNKLTAKPNKAVKDASPAPAPDKPPDPEKPLNPALVPPDNYNPEGTPWNSKEEKEKQEGKVAPVQEAGQKKDSPMASSGVMPSLLSATLAADGYSYCGSFGGN